jgi:hypothetical protein
VLQKVLEDAISEERERLRLKEKEEEERSTGLAESTAFLSPEETATLSHDELAAAVRLMEQRRDAANAELAKLAKQAYMYGVEISDGFGGAVGAKDGSFKRSMSLRKRGSSSRLLGAKSGSDQALMAAAAAAEAEAEAEIDLDDYGSRSDSSDDEDEMYGGIADAHEIQCDVVVEHTGDVMLQHSENQRRLNVCKVTPAKALNVLAVSQREARQILVGSHHRPPRVGLRVKIRRDCKPEDLDDWHLQLGKGKSGSVVRVAPDNKTVQVLWDGGIEPAWYATGKVRAYGETGIRLTRLSGVQLEVSKIEPGAKNSDGDRFNDTGEMILGDIVTEIDGTPVYKLSGDVTHHLRTMVDLGPVDSIVCLHCVDANGAWDVEVKRQVFPHTYDDETEFEKLEVHPQGMYQLEVAESKEGSSWHDTSWHEFKEVGLLIRHAKVEFFHSSKMRNEGGLLGVDLLNAVNQPTNPEHDERSTASKDNWVRVIVGKRVVVEAPANDDANDFFVALSESAGTVRKAHGMVKTKSSRPQVRLLRSIGLGGKYVTRQEHVTSQGYVASKQHLMRKGQMASCS